MIENPPYQDLLGLPFIKGGRDPKTGLDCTGLVMEMLRRCGHDPEGLIDPETYGMEWMNVQGSIWPQDVVFLHDEKHVAYCVEKGLLIHAREGSGVSLAKVSRQKEYITRVMRLVPASASIKWPLGNKGPGVQIMRRKMYSQDKAMSVSPIKKANSAGLFGRALDAILGRNAVLYDYIPEDIKNTKAVFLIRHNGRVIDSKDMVSIRPVDGDCITITRIPGIEAFLISAAIAVVLTIAYYAYDTYIYQPFLDRAEKAGHYGPSYMFGQFRTQSAEGMPVPFGYGEARLGGQYLNRFTRPLNEQDYAYMLIGLGWGPIASATDFELNGVDAVSMLAYQSDLARAHGAAGYTIRPTPTLRGYYYYFASGQLMVQNPTRIYVRRGHTDQDAITDFDDDITSLSYNTQLLNSTPIVLSGTIECEKVGIKIEFKPYGLYQINSDGYPHSWDVTFRYRYRSHAGPGAWQPWAEWSYQRRRKSPFPVMYYITMPRKDVWDVQIERTQKDSDPTDKTPQFGDAYVTEYQQIVEDNHKYPSIAVWALKAVGTEQLGGQVPSGSAHVHQRKIQDIQSASRFYPSEFNVTAGSDASGNRTYTITAPHSFKAGDVVSIDGLIDYPNTGYSWNEVAETAYNVKSTSIDVYSGNPYGSSPTGAFPGKAYKASKNPAAAILDLLYNKTYGGGKYLDTQMTVGITMATGVFSAGETLASEDLFYGTVRDVTGSGPYYDYTIEADEGFPIYGKEIEGSSGLTGTVGEIGELFQADLESFYDASVVYESHVPDGSGITGAVGATSATGATLLYVTGLTGVTAKDTVVVNRDGVREEVCEVVSKGATYLNIVNGLSYWHTATTADSVEKSEQRNQTDIVFERSMPLLQALQRIATNANSWLFTVGEKFYLKPLKAETSLGIISMGNISKEYNLTISYPPKGTRPNVCRVRYFDRDNGFDEDSVGYEDPTAITNSEDLIEMERDGTGIGRRSEAYRLAVRTIKEAQGIDAILEWVMDVDAIDFMPGDVRTIQYDVPGWGTAGGRVKSSTNTTFTTKQTITLGAGTYYVLVRHQDGTEELRQISTAAGSHRSFTVSSNWTTNPSAGDVFAIGLGSAVAKQIRIFDWEMAENFQAKIRAYADADSIYDFDPLLLTEESASELPDPRAIPPDPTDLTLNETQAVDKDGVLRSVIDVNFVKPEHPVYSHSEIWYTRSLGPWDEYGVKQPIGTTSPGNAEISHVEGVAVTDTYVAYTDTYNNRVIVLNRAGLTYSHQFGTLGTGNTNFNHPCGITTDGTYWYIVDRVNNRVKKHQMDGTYVAEIGSLGSTDGKFDQPWDIDYNATTNLLYVLDSGNSRFQVINTAMAFVNKGGSAGSGDGQLDEPKGICSVSNRILIADTGNQRVQYFSTTSYAFTKKIAIGTGIDDGEFLRPVGIESDGLKIWVGDSGYVSGVPYSRIIVFNFQDGSFSETIGSEAGRGVDEFDWPFDMMLDPDDEEYLYVADRNNQRVVCHMVVWPSNDDWEFLGTSQTGHYRITEPPQPGTIITVSVLPVSFTGQKRLVNSGVQEQLEVKGLALTPDDVPQAWIRYLSRTQMQLYWNQTTDRHTHSYEVKKGDDEESASTVATDITELFFNVPVENGKVISYWIYGKNKGGVLSENGKQITINSSPASTRPYQGSVVSATLNSVSGASGGSG